jgi:hypothetical protein
LDTLSLHDALPILFLDACSPRRTPSAQPKDSPPSGESFAFIGGTTMRVRERTGDSLKGIHIVKRPPGGNLINIHAEKGQIVKGPDPRTMHLILYDAHVDSGPNGRAIAEQLTMDLVKELDVDSLQKVARDLRNQRLTNQIQRTGR